MTFATLFGWLDPTGLRVGEASALAMADGDLAGQRLDIHESQCRKSRGVPVSPAPRRALECYIQQRSGLFAPAPPDPLFIHLRGRRFSRPIVYTAFRQALRRCGLRAGKADPGPSASPTGGTALPAIAS